MTNFQLEKKSVGKVLTCFQSPDDQSGACYGSVNVPNEATADFLAHWKGGAPVAAKQPSAAAALSAAFKRAKPRMSKAGILRGC